MSANRSVRSWRGIISDGGRGRQWRWGGGDVGVFEADLFDEFQGRWPLNEEIVDDVLDVDPLWEGKIEDAVSALWQDGKPFDGAGNFVGTFNIVVLGMRTNMEGGSLSFEVSVNNLKDYCAEDEADRETIAEELVIFLSPVAGSKEIVFLLVFPMMADKSYGKVSIEAYWSSGMSGREREGQSAKWKLSVRAKVNCIRREGGRERESVKESGGDAVQERGAGVAGKGTYLLSHVGSRTLRERERVGVSKSGGKGCSIPESPPPPTHAHEAHLRRAKGIGRAQRGEANKGGRGGKEGRGGVLLREVREKDRVRGEENRAG
ncbi:hypothetical protein BDK51DRAFT_26013 [Blyttiomyces helicus]|uniref:Uncharacterized protein n=1 Tax=Blyttiomyces helicus TaxID=388810 RepID=A0A4P9WDA0_9FUNG|nr:hypothetical protein BDK51DRAFT_26013 [Blyttiomyces helicus]|eukprot:RKO89623.1 hypothetical protein BDK51DRAFT_26013 [Blyttiomyces helicus]